MTGRDATSNRRAEARSRTCDSPLDGAPYSLLGADQASVQVKGPAAAPKLSPLHTADHPATSWWSALFRGEKGAVAGEREVMGGEGMVKKREVEMREGVREAGQW